MSLLAPYDPKWPAQAASEILRWQAHVPGLTAVHHIGSTAVIDMPAQPVIDLMAVFAYAGAADAAQRPLAAMGYIWQPEAPVPHHRFAILDDPEGGQPRVTARLYVAGQPAIRAHLAKRDALQADAALRGGYVAEKAACAARFPEGGPAYAACKATWFNRPEVEDRLAAAARARATQPDTGPSA